MSHGLGRTCNVTIINKIEFKRNSIHGRVYKSAYVFGQSVIGLFLASVIASIYIKMTIICAPVLIVMMSNI